MAMSGLGGALCSGVGLHRDVKSFSDRRVTAVVPWSVFCPLKYSPNTQSTRNEQRLRGGRQQTEPGCFSAWGSVLLRSPHFSGSMRL